MKSTTPIGDQAGKDTIFFKRENIGLGYGAMKFIKENRMKAKYRKRIEALEDKMNREPLIPASRIFASFPYYGENVVVGGGNTISLQTLLTLLMDELGLKIVSTPASTKLEKTAGKGGPGSKAIKNG